MARIRLKYVNSIRNRNCKDPTELRHYFRRFGTNIRLPGIPGSEEFMAAYGAALASTSNASQIGAGCTTPGTIGALAAAYYQSAAWTSLPEDTRRNRRPIIERFRTRHGSKRVALLRPHHIEAALKEITGGPATRDYWLRAVRGLMQAAVPALIKENPTAGIRVKRVKNDGHWTWEPEEVEKYRAYWPLGTVPRLVLEFALGTASRRGEIVALGPQHLRRGKKGEWRIKIERIKGSNPVDIPVTAELLAACQAMPKTGLAYVVGDAGTPIAKKRLGALFARWSTEAGLPARCRMHGLKKSSLCRLVLAGATGPEFMAVSGHKDMGVAQKYIEKVLKRPELADAAMAKLENKQQPDVTGGLTKTPQHTYKSG
jgi:integrase